MSDHADDERRRSWRPRSWRAGLLGLLLLFGLIQLVPYGRDHSNPAVTTTPKWTSAKVERLATNACGDCHSNLTTWPWYSNIAPGSWLIQRDVDDGRKSFNWSTGCGEADSIREVIRGGDMPPIQYKLLHPGARLSSSEQRQLANGLADSIARAGGFHECGGGD